MKKALLLLLALGLAIPALAQKVAEKNLLGRWEMCALETSYGLVDFNKDKVTLSDSKKKSVSKEEWPEIEKNMLAGVDYCRLMYLEFKAKGILKHNFDGEDEGAYSIFEKGGKQYLIEPGMPADSDEVNVYIKSGKLHLSVKDDDSSNIVMIFEPVKAVPPIPLGTTTKLSARQLQGAWKLVFYKDEDGIADVKAGKYTLAAGIENRYTAEELDQLKEEFAEITEAFKTSELVFGPRVLVYKIDGDESDRGDYSLEVNEKTYLQIIYQDDEEGESEEMYELYTKNSTLYMETEDGSTYIYERK